MVLQARQQRLSTHAFPELAAALTEFTQQGVVLDGELVVRRSGRLDLAALQDRLRSGPARVAELAAAPSAHVVFDLLATTAPTCASSPTEAEFLAAERWADRRPDLVEHRPGWGGAETVVTNRAQTTATSHHHARISDRQPGTSRARSDRSH